jgi:uncharacterized protein (TIGR02001 family)
MKHIIPATLFAAALTPVAASAQEDEKPAVTVSGSATIASDYRFRGVSQSDKEMAVQGGITLTHESGLYAGVWGSSLAGWGTFGGANMELDLIGGYKLPVADNATLDVGLFWYMYPGGSDESDFAEPYVKLTGTTGPATLTAGVAHAPKQQALANVSAAPNSRGQKDDNLYLWGDGAVVIAGTPLSAKAHVGYSDGNPGLGPNGTSVAPTGRYWDWSLGVDAVWRNLTLNLSYVDTDIGRAEAARLQPNFSKGGDGTGSIADAAVVASVIAAF